MTISGGTLDTSGYANTVNSLTISSGGLNLGVGNLLSVNNAAALGGTINVSGTTSPTTVGQYQLISAGSGVTGSFASGTLSDATRLLFAAQRQLSRSPAQGHHRHDHARPSATASIITGGTTPVSFTVQNSAPSLSDSLAFTATASTNLSGSASGGGLAPGGTSGTISGLAFSGTAVGAAQSGTFSLSGGTDSSNGPLNTTVSVNVYGHAAYRASPRTAAIRSAAGPSSWATSTRAPPGRCRAPTASRSMTAPAATTAWP